MVTKGYRKGVYERVTKGTGGSDERSHPRHADVSAFEARRARFHVFFVTRRYQIRMRITTALPDTGWEDGWSGTNSPR